MTFGRLRSPAEDGDQASEVYDYVAKAQRHATRAGDFTQRAHFLSRCVVAQMPPNQPTRTPTHGVNLVRLTSELADIRFPIDKRRRVVFDD